jgi:hypothetical protein
MVSQAASSPTTMECPVCYCSDATCKLVCGHAFCGQCVKEWWLKSENDTQGCPMCRKPIYFRGMNDKVVEWDDERREQMFERVYSRVFDEIVEDVEDEFGAAMAMFSLREFDEQFKKLKDMDDYDFSEEELYEMSNSIFVEFIKSTPPREYRDVPAHEKMLFVPKHKSAIQRSPKSPRARVPQSPFTDLWSILIKINLV